MSWLSLLIALYMTKDSQADGNVWADTYFDNLVRVEHFFFQLTFKGWIVLLILVAILAVWALRSGNPGGLSCGCPLLFFGVLPIFEFITYKLAQTMADTWGPEGIIHTGKFVVSGVLYLLLGFG